MPQSSSAANINVDINQIATDLNLKADTDLVNVPSNYDYVVESYNDGTNWYRLYKSGWLEQGAHIVSPSKGQILTISLLKPFASDIYNLCVTHNMNSSTVWADATPIYWVGYATKTNSSFKAGCYAGDAYSLDYYAAGQGA